MKLNETTLSFLEVDCIQQRGNEKVRKYALCVHYLSVRCKKAYAKEFPRYWMDNGMGEM